MSMVAMFGTFDVENFGDLLYPIILKHELAKRGVWPVSLYSYRDRKLGEWCYDVHELSTFFSQDEHCDLVAIGGGHLIRFDKDVATNYYPANPGLHHPTSYWLGPALYAIANDLPLVWSGVGASVTIPEWGAPLVRTVLEGSDYISVRDRGSYDVLAKSNPSAEIQIIPDTVFGIKNVFPANASEEFQSFLCNHGIPSKYIVFQPSPFLLGWAQFIVPMIEAAVRHGYTLVSLPISPALGDAHVQWSEHLPATACCVEKWPTPEIIVDLLRHSSGVIGVSLHLTIVSLTYGVPVFRPFNLGVPKYSELSSFRGVYDIEIGSDTFLSQLGQSSQSQHELDDMQQRLSRHWDRIATAVGSTKGGGKKRKALLHLLSQLPFLLETNSTGRD